MILFLMLRRNIHVATSFQSNFGRESKAQEPIRDTRWVCDLIAYRALPQ